MRFGRGCQDRRNQQCDGIGGAALAHGAQVEDGGENGEQQRRHIHIERVEVTHVKEIAKQQQGEGREHPTGERNKKQYGQQEERDVNGADCAEIERASTRERHGRCDRQEFGRIEPGVVAVSIAEEKRRVGVLEGLPGAETEAADQLTEIAVIRDTDHGRQHQLPAQSYRSGENQQTAQPGRAIRGFLHHFTVSLT